MDEVLLKKENRVCFDVSIDAIRKYEQRSYLLNLPKIVISWSGFDKVKKVPSRRNKLFKIYITVF